MKKERSASPLKPEPEVTEAPQVPETSSSSPQPERRMNIILLVVDTESDIPRPLDCASMHAAIAQMWETAYPNTLDEPIVTLVTLRSSLTSKLLSRVVLQPSSTRGLIVMTKPDDYMTPVPRSRHAYVPGRTYIKYPFATYAIESLRKQQWCFTHAPVTFGIDSDHTSRCPFTIVDLTSYNGPSL
jgi:hypothetical protein